MKRIIFIVLLFVSFCSFGQDKLIVYGDTLVVNTKSGVTSMVTQHYNLLTPTNFAANAVSTTRIDLYWVNHSNNYETAIERSLNGIAWTIIDTVSSGVYSFINTGLTGATLYYYRIRQFHGTVYSGYSAVITKSTL